MSDATRDSQHMAMTVGELAKSAKVNDQTVRYYERRGLIAEPSRTPAGYRQYPDDAPKRIRFIRSAQDLGFSLKEIKELLGLRVDAADTCVAVEGKARGKIAVVETKIEELHRMKSALERLVTSCQQNEVTGECPMLEVLQEIEGDLD